MKTAAAAEEQDEIRGAPAFLPGDKVRSTRQVRNDGTFPGKDVGVVLVKKGDVGYVRDVGTFLQRHYVYAVEFYERGAVVGMRARELTAVGPPIVGLETLR